MSNMIYANLLWVAGSAFIAGYVDNMSARLINAAAAVINIIIVAMALSKVS